MKKEIEQRTLQLNAPKSNAEIKKMLMEKIAERRCNNTYAREAIDFSFSDVTFYKYKKIMGLTPHVGDGKITTTQKKKEEKAEKKKAKDEERALLLKKAAEEADGIKFVFEDQDSGSTSRASKRQKKF